MSVYTPNPSTGETEARVLWFEASLGYKRKLFSVACLTNMHRALGWGMAL